MTNHATNAKTKPRTLKAERVVLMISKVKPLLSSNTLFMFFVQRQHPILLALNALSPTLLFYLDKSPHKIYHKIVKITIKVL